MVISREVGSKVLRMHDHSLENCKYNVKNFRRFLFGMSPYVWAFKVRDFTGDLEILNWSKWISVIIILTPVLPTLINLIALLNFACNGWLLCSLVGVITLIFIQLEEWSMGTYTKMVSSWNLNFFSYYFWYTLLQFKIQSPVQNTVALNPGSSCVQ